MTVYFHFKLAVFLLKLQTSILVFIYITVIFVEFDSDDDGRDYLGTGQIITMAVRETG